MKTCFKKSKICTDNRSVWIQSRFYQKNRDIKKMRIMIALFQNSKSVYFTHGLTSFEKVWRVPDLENWRSFERPRKISDVNLGGHRWVLEGHMDVGVFEFSVGRKILHQYLHLQVISLNICVPWESLKKGFAETYSMWPRRRSMRGNRRRSVISYVFFFFFHLHIIRGIGGNIST